MTVVPCLVYMAKYNTPHLRKSVQALQETMGFCQGDGIHPAASDGHRGMMRGHQARSLSGAQCSGEPVQLLRFQCTIGLPCQVRVEPNDGPVANDCAARSNKGVTAQAAPEQLRLIMIPWQEHHWAMTSVYAVSQ